MNLSGMTHAEARYLSIRHSSDTIMGKYKVYNPGSKQLMSVRKMISFRKVALTVSGVRNRSVITVHETKVASRHAFADERQNDSNYPTIEGVQGPDRDISAEESRKILEEAIEYSIHGPSVQGIQGGHDELVALGNASATNVVDSQIPENIRNYSYSRNISLHGCMQTNVPDPYKVQSGHFTSQLDHGTPQNMPGNGKKLYQKYISGGRNDVNSSQPPRRSFHVGVQHLSQDTQPNYHGAFIDNSVKSQGIEGVGYGLKNYDKKYNQFGMETQAHVFLEQEEIIRNTAERNRKSIWSHQSNVSPDTPMDVSALCSSQANDDITFGLWLENCNGFHLHKYRKENLQWFKIRNNSSSRIFNQQDQTIYSFVIGCQQMRHYSTSKQNQDSQEVGNNPPESDQSLDNSAKYSRANLKKAIAEYGSTVIIFHVSLALMSLGGFYALVSSGIDVVGLLTKVGIGESISQSKVAAGASTFVIAYAVHKVFAPVRIGITLTATPFIVQYLRRVGFLKAPRKSTPKST
ncbi:uncharacterized protein LOC132556645 [Ylistrum balloti]|uniref:uncharacterized protein LOC132556645 n=1 Tax=Ylistrum balloti TaxID=509963 RepID=UPI002905AE50|nr:uncharacterized protein LOC132556645 [Ylistrum balloti]